MEHLEAVGPSQAEEQQRINEALIAVRRVVNGCPDLLPGHALRALEAAMDLLERHGAQTPGARTLEVV